MDSNCVLEGDLNPLSGFPFPLFSMVLPWKSAIRVENTGRQWKQNCCKSTYFFCVGYIHSSLKIARRAQNRFRLAARSGWQLSVHRPFSWSRDSSDAIGQVA